MWHWELVGVEILGQLVEAYGEHTGPAHAVYFSTYEYIKHKLGANEGTEHRPFSAGEDRYPGRKISLI